MANRPAKKNRAAAVRRHELNLQAQRSEQTREWRLENDPGPTPTADDIALRNIRVTVQCRKCGEVCGELIYWDDEDDLYLVPPWRAGDDPTGNPTERLRGNTTVQAKCAKASHPPIVLPVGFLRAKMAEARRKGESIRERR